MGRSGTRAGRVSRLGLPGNHLHFEFPAGITVTSPAEARAVSRALCALPVMPSTPMPCPMDQGVSYRLDFAAGRASFPGITAAPVAATW
jgi:hypothetical protein